MFEIFSTITSILFVVNLVVMFIGYWTYADYYTKLNEQFLFIYWLVSGIIFFISLEMFLITLVDTDFINSIIKIFTFIRYVSIFVIVLLVGLFLGYLFVKSRTYFGKKRNKI